MLSPAGLRSGATNAQIGTDINCDHAACIVLFWYEAARIIYMSARFLTCKGNYKDKWMWSILVLLHWQRHDYLSAEGDLLGLLDCTAVQLLVSKTICPAHKLQKQAVQVISPTAAVKPYLYREQCLPVFGRHKHRFWARILCALRCCLWCSSRYTQV
jgi:hypothetical protein